MVICGECKINKNVTDLRFTTDRVLLCVDKVINILFDVFI